MPNSPALSFSGQVQTAPPREKTFAAGSDTAKGLMTARRWVEDQAREFLAKHSLPKNPWDELSSGWEASSSSVRLSRPANEGAAR